MTMLDGGVRTPTEVPARRRRPRDRRDRIIAAAAVRFHQFSYHGVRMADIAADVGITAGALYRHFTGKQELLAEVCFGEMNRLDEAMRPHLDDLDALLAALARFAVDRRAASMLWQRESRHLALPDQRALRLRLRRCVFALARAIRLRRPQLCPVDADLLAWCTASVVASPSHHRTAIEPPRFELLLHRLAATICASDVSARVRATPPADPVPQPRPPAAGRETLVDAGARQFSQRGFATATVSDLCVAASIVVGDFYRHFGSKQDLLVLVMSRGLAAAHTTLADEFGNVDEPGRALATLVHRHVHSGIVKRDLFGALITEIPSLPPDERQAILRELHGYIGRWVDLVTAARPLWSAAEARIVVHAVLAVVNHCVRTHHLYVRPRLADELAGICTEILDLGRHRFEL